MIVVRPARREDAAAIAAIGNADAAAVGGEPELSEEETAHWFDLPDHEAWLAELDGEPVAFAEGIAGVSLCRSHPSGDPGIGFVSILGVLPRARRRGLGLALLLHSFAGFRRRGMHTAQLGDDAESTTGALELYERGGMHVLRRTHIWDRA